MREVKLSNSRAPKIVWKSLLLGQYKGIFVYATCTTFTPHPSSIFKTRVTTLKNEDRQMDIDYLDREKFRLLIWTSFIGLLFIQ